MDQDIRQRLIEVARRRATICYSELRPEAPRTLAVPLDEINTYEHREGRPLLSAVVVRKDGNGMPGEGFFYIAWQLGRFLYGDEHRYWRQELDKVWNFWAANP